jgi:hypothetical protein
VELDASYWVNLLLALRALLGGGDSVAGCALTVELSFCVWLPAGVA